MPPKPLAVGTLFAVRYEIQRQLGAGGSAVVYLARDTRHGRLVALKVLRPDVSAVLGADRFLREISTAAGLQHPNIVPLHDSGESDGRLYYVMPFIEGESLRSLVERGGRVPVDQALAIVREVAGALAYAHRSGLVHRDIKPENILLTGIAGDESHAMVSDFGIARAIATTGGERLTETGLVIGTPAYMSPEQAAGDRAIDGRSDIYALACVLYELLAGHPPFRGHSGVEIMGRHFRDAVPSLRSIRPDVPEAIDQAVLKALAKHPAERFATTTAFVRALEGPVAQPGRHERRRLTITIVVLLLALAIGAVAARRLGSGLQSSGHLPTIAVLAFDNVGGDPTNEPFSDGVADELTTALGQVEDLSVAARSSAFSFKGSDFEPREIGRRLQVQYVVEGAVRRSETRRRVSAQLIDVASGRELWAGSYDHAATGGDIFAAQDSIAQAILRELRIKLGSRTPGTSKRTADPVAHDLYLQGRYFFAKRDSLSLARARDYFERAIARDSTYALAFAGLADAYSHASVFGYTQPQAAFAAARTAATRALSLDSSLAEAHTSLGFIALFYDFDFDLAGREFERALAIDPRHAPAHLFRAWYLVARHRMAEAVTEFEAAVRFEPFYVISNVRLAGGLVLARRYDAALAQARRTLELEPGFPQARAEVARSELYLGRCDEALRDLEGIDDQVRAAIYRGLAGFAYAKCGRRSEAVNQLRRLEARARRGEYVSHYGLAMIYAGLGDRERAFAELDSAWAERAWALFILRADPAWDGLREDPRFVRITERVGR